MKKRLVYLLLFFVAVLFAFVLQKPCFMLYYDAISRGVSFNDYIQVMWHGVSLDARIPYRHSLACYIGKRLVQAIPTP